MVTSVGISIYGIHDVVKQPTKLQMHKTTYLEYEIPEKLEKKLTLIIDKEIGEFHKKCKCKDCKSRKK